MPSISRRHMGKAGLVVLGLAVGIVIAARRAPASPPIPEDLARDLQAVTAKQQALDLAAVLGEADRRNSAAHRGWTSDSALAEQHGSIAQLEKRARAGDYQAQRNLAYRYSRGDALIQRRPLDACAWRTVILASGKTLVDQSDVANQQFDCAGLSEPERVAARSKAERIVLESPGISAP